MSELKTIKSEHLYKGRAVNLRVDTVELPSGRRTTREIVEHGDSVAIVPIDTDGSVLLVRQFREAVERELLEIPAGGIDPGEEPGESAQRELREETGYLAERMEYLGGFYSSPGFSTEYLYLFLATELRPGPLSAPDGEVIELVRIPLDSVLGLIARGEICDSKSIAGLMRVIMEHRWGHETA